MPLNKSAVQAHARRLLDPLAGLILRLGFSPDALTLAGLILSLLAGYQIARGRYIPAAVLLFFGGLCDILDGSMARRSDRVTRRGAFLDSTLDRLAEIAVFLGLVVHYQGNVLMQALSTVAMTGSLLTSYARARAEGLGIDCKVGLVERPERVTLLIVGLLAAPLRVGGYGVLELIIAALALLTYFTTFQRIVHVVSQTSEEPRDRGESGEPGGVQDGDSKALSAPGRQQ